MDYTPVPDYVTAQILWEAAPYGHERARLGRSFADILLSTCRDSQNLTACADAFKLGRISVGPPLTALERHRVEQMDWRDMESDSLQLVLAGELDKPTWYACLSRRLVCMYELGQGDCLADAEDFARAALKQVGNYADRSKLLLLARVLELRARQDTNHNIAYWNEVIELHRTVNRLHLESEISQQAINDGAKLAEFLIDQFQRTRERAFLDEANTMLLSLLDKSRRRGIHLDHTWLLLRLTLIYAMEGTPYNDVTQASYYRQEALLAMMLHKVREMQDWVLNSWYSRMSSPNAWASEILLAYTNTLNGLPWLASVVLSKQDQLGTLGFTGSLGALIFTYALRVGAPEIGLQAIERTRGVLFSQATAFRDIEYPDLPAAHQLQAILVKLDEELPEASWINFRTNDSWTRKQLLGLRIDTLLQEIRAAPDHARFMQGLSVAELRAAATNPIVLLTAVESECWALALMSPEADLIPIQLPDLTISNVRQMASILISDQDQSRAPACSEDGSTNRALRLSLLGDENTLLPLLKELWLKVVKPILDAIGFEPARDDSIRPRLHWCPTGPFSFLPLHAAGIFDRQTTCCADYVVSSYTPTVSALVRARKHPIQLAKDRIDAVVLAAPDVPGMNRIPFANTEIEQVQSVLQDSFVSKVTAFSNSSLDDTLHALPTTNILHLACHGTQNQKAPLEGAFHLPQDRLTISKLLDTCTTASSEGNRGSEIAFLSACETAYGALDRPDESVHLASAMLFAGFRSVIASFWKMTDEDGPHVARDFYEALMAHEIIDADAIARAFDTAAGKLRRSGVSAKRWTTFLHVGA